MLYPDGNNYVEMNLNPSQKSSVSIEDLISIWLVYIKKKVKSSTYAQYVSVVNSHILPYFRNVYLSEITNECLDNFVHELTHFGRKDGKGGLAPKTVGDILVIMKNILHYAQKRGENVRVEDWESGIKKEKHRPRVLSIYEQQKFMKYLRNNLDIDRLGVILCLYTGLRIGELCALKWEDILIEEQTIYISKTLQRIRTFSEGSTKTHIVVSTPKSQSSIREIPLPVFLIPMLEKYQKEPNTYFLTGKKERFIEPRLMEYHFDRYIKESGLEKATFHDLRHTFATRCVELDFELKSLSEILGHANVNITLNLYVHPSYECKKMNMQKLETIVY